LIYRALGAVMRVILKQLSKRKLPQVEGTLELPGLKAPVEVIRDKWGVPHIYAENDHDLFFAQGFVEAQDRFWQLELNRRTATGRLSEIFGEIALDTDRATRTFGFARLGKKDWENADSRFKEIVQAYADGVNAYIQAGKFPVEFSLLRHSPEPWTAEDSMAFSRVMIWQLSHAWYGEIVRSRLIDAVGAEHAAELDIEYPPANPVTLPDGIKINDLAMKDMLDKEKAVGRGKGSNTWTISTSRSMNGSTYLCNDMHLAMMLPAIWYECHLVSENFNVSGVSLPGVPMIMVGHNNDIAWGMTLAYTDAEDLFIEKMNPDNPEQYEYQGKMVDAEVIEEKIMIKGKKEPHVEKVLVTRHGTIISDIVGVNKERLAVCSMALRPCPAIQGWLKINEATNWKDFTEAVRLIEAPQLNISYADKRGNTGYWVTGKIPVRAKGNGTVPAPGWTGEYDWTGEVPFDEMPHMLNPEKGYFVNTNNKIIADDYPHFLGNLYMNGYRARRITDFIESRGKVGVDDFKMLHMDFTSIPGLELVEKLEGFESNDPDVKLALEILRSWDGQLDPESTGGTVYSVSRYMLIRNILEPALGEKLASVFMGEGFHELLYKSHEFHGQDTVVMLRMLDNPESWWVKQAGGRDELINKSLKGAIEWLRKELGNKQEKWQWGKLHRVTFPHAMALQKPLRR